MVILASSLPIIPPSLSNLLPIAAFNASTTVSFSRIAFATSSIVSSVSGAVPTKSATLVLV